MPVGFFASLVKNWRFWLTLIILVLAFFVIRRNWYRFSRIFRPRDIDLKKGETGKVPETQQEVVDQFGTGTAFKSQTELKDIGGRLYTLIYSFKGGTASKIHTILVTEVLPLSDSELLFLSQYYRKFVSKNTFYDDIDNEWMPLWESDEDLLVRLAKIGED